VPTGFPKIFVPDMFSRAMTMRLSPAQLSFPGLDSADRLFFAIFPDAPAARHTAEIAERLRAKCGLRGWPLARRRFHVSLHFLGDYSGLPNEVVTKASNAASGVAEAPFSVTFDRAGSFPGRRRNPPLVLRCSDAAMPLIAFQQALGEAMVRNGLGCWVAPHYVPHMTLLYDASHVEIRAVEPVAWTVREFVLVHSLLGRTKHIPVARWPLRGTAYD
jgi:2'-5' RNA ligase